MMLWRITGQPELKDPEQVRDQDCLTLMIMGSLKSSVCLLSTVTETAWGRTPLAFVPLSELYPPFLSQGWLIPKKKKTKLQTPGSLAHSHAFIFLSPYSCRFMSARKHGGNKSLAGVVNLFIPLLLSASGTKLLPVQQIPPFFKVLTEE